MSAYFDYAASAPLDPLVREAVCGAMNITGNPSATHSFGREARKAIDCGRRQVAGLFGCETDEIVFTSGATEANVTALVSAWKVGAREAAEAGVRARIAVSAVEHPSVKATIERLAAEDGALVDVIPVDADGRVSIESVRAAIRPETVLVAVMWVNNVLGTVQPVADVGTAATDERKRRQMGDVVLPIFFHCDAVQAVSWIDVRPGDIQADTISVSAHKICGPKGIGALRVRRGLSLSPLLTGGGQEAGWRSGTENVSGIAGFGAAAEILRERRADDLVHAGMLRDRLLSGLATFGDRLCLISPAEGCVPGMVYLMSRREPGDALALKLDAAGFAVTSGSACDAGSRKTSSVLAAALGEQRARQGGIRISFGRFTTAAEIDGLIGILGRLA